MTLDRWSSLIFNKPALEPMSGSPFIIGVLEGEGVGPEVIQSSLVVLSALESTGSFKFDINYGGPIGLEAEKRYGKFLCDEVIAFHQDIFSRGGAVLSGPGGGRYVYDLRRRFDLFCKLSPVKTSKELAGINRIKPEYINNVDIMLVRENSSGIYQGECSESSTPDEGLKAEHRFFYTEREVRRILRVAAKIARERRGLMHVVVKDAGISTVSDLWRKLAVETAREFDIESAMINIDFAAYCLIQHAQEFDVVVSPNLFGDVLSDIAGVLLGSRAFSFSGNYSSQGGAVYQTNHGSAYELAGSNKANPIGQIFSLCMMLQENFGLVEEARAIEGAVMEVWHNGWRTAEVTEPGCRVAGTMEMADLIADVLIKTPKVSN